MLTYSKTAYTDKQPFLSIITRVYKRPIGLSRNLESIRTLTDHDIEQIFITDHCGLGLLSANKSFGNPETRALVTGKYVFLLDDDDFIVNPKMVEELKAEAERRNNPWVIFFRMNIIGGPNGDLYPTPETWKIAPKVAHIGGSCFVVRRDIYERHIAAFGLPRMGDFAYIDTIWRGGNSAYCVWLDKLMCQTGQIGRGRPETC